MHTNLQVSKENSLDVWIQIADDNHTRLFYPRKTPQDFSPVQLVFLKRYDPTLTVTVFEGSICSYVHLNAGCV